MYAYKAYTSQEKKRTIISLSWITPQIYDIFIEWPVVEMRRLSYSVLLLCINSNIVTFENVWNADKGRNQVWNSS